MGRENLYRLLRGHGPAPGRGDIKRLLDRTERLKAMCIRSAEIADVSQFQNWILDLKRETSALRRPLDAGPFDADSLIAKCMKTVLTRE